jgi:mono/diheme cytochrome c family protein
MKRLFPVGLLVMVCASSAMMLARNAVPLQEGGGRDAGVSRGAAEAYYTDAQAARGAAAYKQHCEKCHAEGYKNHARMKFQGQPAYPSVYYLYTRLKDQPPQTAAITPRTRADITAYMLQTSGFPAGASELPPDEEAMKLMPLDEPGFMRIFNGKDLSGFTFVTGEIIGGADGRVIPCTKPGGCESAPAPNWIVRNGTIVCTCKEHGYFYTKEKYQNFTLKLDYRFLRPVGWEGPDYLFGGNSGYYVFLDPANAKAIALEGKNRQVLWPYAINSKAKYSEDNEARNRAIHPLGEWNSIEIVSKDGTIKSYLNGTLITTVTDHEFKAPGHVGFQNQGAELHWRNIRIRTE